MAADEPLRTSVAADLGSAAELVRPLAAPTQTLAPGAAAPVPTGGVIGGHFEVEAPLGRGGMGVVYRALDRRLGRKVALKLGLRGADVARARREATALARLAHPNVVTIHEIGEHDGAPFVAMELCAGGNARAWLAAAPRTWREILDVYVAAGRGLAAAHAAGLVHRDVKPDNILLGADGRARIGDFGLARDAVGLTGAAAPTGASAVSGDASTLDDSASVASPPPSPWPGSGSDDRLTVQGAIVGTPRYMAPEQRVDGPVDARADQFALALALYEALAGDDPLPAAAPARAAAIAEGRLRPLPRAIPRGVGAALARALRADPAARWPTLDALLDRLVAAARPRWRTPAIVAAATAGAVGLVVVGLAVASSRGGDAAPAAGAAPAPQPADDPCAGLPAAVDDVWSPSTRDGVIAAHPRGAGAAALLADAIDGLAAEWTVARRRLCTELPATPAWSEALGAAGAACLARRRDDLGRLIALRDRDPAGLTRIVGSLSWPSSCAEPSELPVSQTDPEVARVEAALLELDRLAAAGDEATRLTQARALVEGLAPDAPPLARGLTEHALGSALLAHKGMVEAYDHLRAGFFGFRAAGSPQAFDAASGLCDALAAAGQLDLAAEWLAHAQVEASRLALRPHNRAMLALLGARIRGARGDHAGAIAEVDAALAALARDDDPLRAVTTLHLTSSRSIFLADAGRFEESLAAAREVLAGREQLYGPAHPDLIGDLFNVGLGELDLGRPDAALPHLRRARLLADAHLPRDAVMRGYALWNEALALGRTDRPAARPLFDEALAIVVAGLGQDSPDAVQLRADRAKWSARPR